MRLPIRNALLITVLACSVLPAVSADFRELNRAGISALRDGEHAKAADLFQKALENYSPEASHYDEGIKANLKLAEGLLAGHKLGQVHAGYVSKEKDKDKEIPTSTTSKKIQGQRNEKIFRPLLTGKVQKEQWDLSARKDSIGAMDSFGDLKQDLSGATLYSNSRLGSLLGTVDENRMKLDARMAEIQARIAEDERESRSPALFIPASARYVLPPPSYRTYDPFRFAPMVPVPPGTCRVTKKK